MLSPRNCESVDSVEDNSVKVFDIFVYMICENYTFKYVISFLIMFRLFSGVCLYLPKNVSRVAAYYCHHFRYGCHTSPFLSNKIFERKCKT